MTTSPTWSPLSGASLTDRVFAGGAPVGVSDVARRRDERAEYQRRLCAAHPGETLVAAKLNIAGPVKSTPVIAQGFAVLMARLDAALAALGAGRSDREASGCGTPGSEAALASATGLGSETELGSGTASVSGTAPVFETALAFETTPVSETALAFKTTLRRSVEAVADWTGDAGPERFLLVAAAPEDVKRAVVAVEDHEPGGRLLDLDVWSQPDPATPARALSRTELGESPRQCLVCERGARGCARSRRHSLAELQAATARLVQDALLAAEPAPTPAPAPATLPSQGSPSVPSPAPASETPLGSEPSSAQQSTLVRETLPIPESSIGQQPASTPETLLR